MVCCIWGNNKATTSWVIQLQKMEKLDAAALLACPNISLGINQAIDPGPTPNAITNPIVETTTIIPVALISTDSLLGLTLSGLQSALVELLSEYRFSITKVVFNMALNISIPVIPIITWSVLLPKRSIRSTETNVIMHNTMPILIAFACPRSVQEGDVRNRI